MNEMLYNMNKQKGETAEWKFERIEIHYLII